MMGSRPIIKLHLSKFDARLETTGFILVSILWILTFIIYFMLPETIPTHFNASGVPNDFGSKNTFLLLPLIGTIVFFGLTILNKYPQIFNYPSSLTKENAEQQYTNATRMLRFLKLAIIVISIVLVLLTYFTAMGEIKGLAAWLLPFIFCLVLSPTIFFLVKGFRTK